MSALPNMSPLQTEPGEGGAALRARRGDALRHDVPALLILGLAIGLACRGHFVMPYSDFFEFIDGGHALLHGHLPPTLKRPPVYGVLVVTLSKLVPAEAPERVVAEWLNALLLPINGLLVYLIGRRWFGAAARWATVWFLLLPIGMYCTAHLISEPLLTCLILLAVWLAQRGTAWAYVAAAAATMARFDAAGLILGVALADLLRRRTVRATAVRMVLAAAPLVAWLALTALTWTERSEDHYLVRAAEQWQGLRPVRAFSMITQAGFDPQLVQPPAWRFLPEPFLHWTAILLPLAMAAVGLAVGSRAPSTGALVATVALLAYTAVHAIIPFDIERYGYPPAPLLIVLVAAGLHATCRWFRRHDARGVGGRVLLWMAGLLLMLALIDEARAAALAAVGPSRLIGRLGWPALLASVLVWAVAVLRRRQRLGQVVLLLGVAVLATEQVSRAAALLGPGDNLRNEVEAARWVRGFAPPGARVLSATPGLLRLYVGREPPDRFVGFGDIRSQAWPEIIDECRRRHIAYMIWHDELGQEHGPYYAEKWGLSRFDPLAHLETATGVQVVRTFPKHPNVVIVRVEPAPATVRIVPGIQDTGYPY